MTIVSLAVVVLTNVRLAQFRKVTNILSIQDFALTVAHVLMYAQQKLFIRRNNPARKK
jgi:hypothetical protein